MQCLSFQQPFFLPTSWINCYLVGHTENTILWKKIKFKNVPSLFVVPNKYVYFIFISLVWDSFLTNCHLPCVLGLFLPDSARVFQCCCNPAKALSQPAQVLLHTLEIWIKLFQPDLRGAQGWFIFSLDADVGRLLLACPGRWWGSLVSLPPFPSVGWGLLEPFCLECFPLYWS